MNNKKNIIIFLLVIIFILQFLTFIKLKTAKIDNFTDNSTTIYTSYSLIGVSTSSMGSSLKYTLWGYMIVQATIYSILLQLSLQKPVKDANNSLKTDDNGVLGLIFYLSFIANVPGIKVNPIIAQMSNNTPLSKYIQNLTSSFNSEQITTITTRQDAIITFWNQYKNATPDNRLLMITDLTVFSTLIETLKLTKEQLTLLKSITTKWSPSLNSYFTIERFQQLSFPIGYNVEQYNQWRDFFTACKI
jgi:hypothetical protein